MKYVTFSALLLTASMFLLGCPQTHKQDLGVTPEGPTESGEMVDNLPPDDSFTGGGTIVDSAPPPIPDAGGARTYTVQASDKGKGLMHIARTQLGSAHRWREILDMNPDLQPRDNPVIKVGQIIKLPAK